MTVLNITSGFKTPIDHSLFQVGHGLWIGEWTSRMNIVCGVEIFKNWCWCIDLSKLRFLIKFANAKKVCVVDFVRHFREMTNLFRP